jgi:hypothetical protein
MKQITKIVIALDKGTSFYEDENGEKITSRLTTLLKPDTLIQAKNLLNKNSLNLFVYKSFVATNLSLLFQKTFATIIISVNPL